MNAFLDAMLDCLQMAMICATSAAIFFTACAAWVILHDGGPIWPRIVRWHWRRVATRNTRKGKW